jgi:hypothetical protein
MSEGGEGEGEGANAVDAEVEEVNQGGEADKRGRDKRGREQAVGRNNSLRGFIICFLSVFPKHILMRRSQESQESKEIGE